MRFLDFLRGVRPPTKMKPSRGKGPTINGKKNEVEVCDQLRRLRYRGEAIEVADPAGTKKNAPDTVLTVPGMPPVVLELKTAKAYEGGGSNLAYRDGRYALPKNPIIQKYYTKYPPWGGRAPSCFKGDKSPETWERERGMFDEDSEDVPPTTVAENYRAKGVHYIHVRGKGIYHTGEDPMGWGVPMFVTPCKLRIRAKQHGSSPVPQDVQVSLNYNKNLTPSPYDFMDLARLPPGFTAE